MPPRILDKAENEKNITIQDEAENGQDPKEVEKLRDRNTIMKDVTDSLEHEIEKDKSQ
jgi:hypothetical protein